MSIERKESEFSARMHEIAQEATKLVEGQKNKSVIIITTESDDDGTGAMIAIAGRGSELAKCIAELASSNESKSFFGFGLHLAQRKIAANAVESMFEELLKK